MEKATIVSYAAQRIAAETTAIVHYKDLLDIAAQDDMLTNSFVYDETIEVLEHIIEAAQNIRAICLKTNNILEEGAAQ